MSLVRHTAYNLAGYLAPLLVSILTVPVYLKLVGIERYGLLAICWTLLGFMGFLSLGMGPAVAQRLAVERNSSPETRSEIFWSAVILSGGMALVGGSAIWLLSGVYFDTVPLSDPALRGEIARALPWLALTFVISLATGVLNGALQGRQWFGALNVLGIGTAVAIAVAPLLTAWLIGPTLPVLLLTTLCVYGASYAAQMAVCRRAVPLHHRPRLAMRVVRQLFSYGGWMTVVSLLAPMTMLSDRLVLGSRLGSAAVPIYVVPYNLVSRIVALPASLSSASLPKLAAARGQEEQVLLTLGLRLLLTALVPVCIGGNMIMAPFLHFWVGDAIAVKGAMVGCALVVGFWMHGIGHIPSTVLLGRGRPDIIAKLYLLYLIVYIPLLVALIFLFGIVGAAAAWAVRATGDWSLFWWARPSRRETLQTGAATALVISSSMVSSLLDWHRPTYWFAMTLLLFGGLVMSSATMPQGMTQKVRAILGFSGAPSQTGDSI